MALKRQRMEMGWTLEREKMVMEMELRRQELQAEAELRVAKAVTDADISTNAEELEMFEFRGARESERNSRTRERVGFERAAEKANARGC